MAWFDLVNNGMEWHLTLLLFPPMQLQAPPPGRRTQPGGPNRRRRQPELSELM